VDPKANAGSSTSISNPRYAAKSLRQGAALAVILAMGLLISPQNSLGMERCAVTVTVVNEATIPIKAQQEVLLIGPAGQVVGSSRTQDGVARFCEFGFGPHHILVGNPSNCGAVEIKNVRYDPFRDQSFRVYLNPCLGGSQLSTGCVALLRVVNGKGDPVVNAVSMARGKVRQSDRSSLFIYRLRVGEELAVSFEADGYQPADTTLACRYIQLFEREIVLVQR